MVDLEVGHPDAAGAAVILELLQHLPGGDEVAVVEPRQRPVDQEEVDVVEAQRRYSPVECASRIVGLVETVAELAGDVHLAAVDAGIPDALPDALFVLVHLGGVDGDSRSQGGAHRCRGLIWCDLEDTEPELGIEVPSFNVKLGIVLICSACPFPWCCKQSSIRGGF